METNLLRVGDGVEHRGSGNTGTVIKPATVAGWFYVGWNDGYLGLHEISELKLIRRVEATLSYFVTAEILEEFRPDTPCEWSDEAETVFLRLMAGWQQRERLCTLTPKG